MSNSGSSLRPGWHKGGTGRGFQPPPTASDRDNKSRSGSWGSQGERRDANKFAALDDDDEGVLSTSAPTSKSTNSRSEAFRSSFRGSTTGSKPGRSLADLAASVPEGTPSNRRSAGYERTSSTGSRFSGLRSETGAEFKPDPKVVRFTREKLLSIRPAPKSEAPEELKEFEGAVIISTEPQDPVCWDTFDAEEIWEGYRERRNLPKTEVARSSSTGVAEERRRGNSGTGGRWARGVALPPPEEGGRRSSNRDADNPNELWDDPIGGATGAAADFSAFGGMPEEAEAFDFDKMAEASKKLEEELHGKADADGEAQGPNNRVDTSRPLASAGMTITSGSGDDVNVFEDFDPPTVVSEPPAIRNATENTTASSRLMEMIGVTKEPASGKSNGGSSEPTNPWGASPDDAKKDPIFGGIGGIGGVPLNPWGAAAGAPASGDGAIGLSDVFGAGQKQDMEKRALEQQMLRRRQEEEAQRMAMQRQVEQARQQQQAVLQQQQQASQQSQVELVLIERICAILENSWGRSDLVSILTTLHAEDARVVPLLSSVDALRALIARSPQRIALRRDPSFAGEMAQLVLTNAQWQEQQQQVQARLQQEEQRRRQMEEEARAKQNRKAPQIDPNAPWFYSDPQKNIQGPFRGEEMRQWLEAGYFKGDLPISQQPSGPFVSLQALFPDLNSAFRASSDDGDAEKAVEVEGHRRLAEEEERRAVEAKAAQAKAAKREVLERERLAAVEADAAAARQANVTEVENPSSNKLKIMLGMSSGNQTPEPAAIDSMSVQSKKQNDKTTKSKKVPPSPAEQPPVSVQQPMQPTKPAAPAWGTAGNAKPKKTMSEIQQEEARAAAILAAQRDSMPNRSSSGWANVAATGKGGWESGTIKPTPSGAANAATKLHPSQARRVSQPTLSVAKQNSLNQQNRSVSLTGSSTPAEEFGASMSPALEKWCKEQMRVINGSEDLTLVAFCMTLNDANEIRQYLTTYLGSTGPVNSFATEFISKRGLGSKQEEWETLGSPKKGRKKKGGR